MTLKRFHMKELRQSFLIRQEETLLETKDYAYIFGLKMIGEGNVL